MGPSPGARAPVHFNGDRTMHARMPNRTLAAMLAVLALTPIAGAQAQRRDQRPNTAAGTPIDFRFDGGTAVEYVDALRAVAPTLNVVLEPDAALVRIEPVDMRHVDPETAIYLLDDMTRILDDNQRIELDVQTILRSPGTAPLYQVFVERRASRPQSIPVSHVWSLRELIEGGTPADHVLTAIEAALDLSDGQAPAKLRFHPETFLLLVHAQPAQLETIDAIVEELTRAQRGAAPTEQERNAKSTEVNLRKSMQELAVARRELVEYRSALAVAKRELDLLETRLRDAEAMVQAERSQRLDLEMMMQRLERQLRGTTDPE